MPRRQSKFLFACARLARQTTHRNPKTDSTLRFRPLAQPPPADWSGVGSSRIRPPCFGWHGARRLGLRSKVRFGVDIADGEGPEQIRFSCRPVAHAARHEPSSTPGSEMAGVGSSPRPAVRTAPCPRGVFVADRRRPPLPVVRRGSRTFRRYRSGSPACRWRPDSVAGSGRHRAGRVRRRDRPGRPSRPRSASIPDPSRGVRRSS